MTSSLRPLGLAAALFLPFPAALAVNGCHGDVVDPSADAGTTATCSAEPCGPVDAGSFSCGAETCGPGQACVEPCCGGAPPDCQPVPASGACPYGYEAVDGCEADGYFNYPGCLETGGCTPDPPTCVDISPACQSELTCGCAPANSCVASDCEIDGRHLYCTCG